MKRNYLKWAFKIFVLSIFLSIVFSMISQSMFPNLPAFISIFIIFFFVAVSGVFDMIGIAITSTTLEMIKKFDGQKGFRTALYLCKNTDKISSFCGDVVGDICGILSGAGGVSLVVNLHITNQTIYLIVTCLVSSFIAGLTIFFKAILKNYAVTNGANIVMQTAKILESKPLSFFIKKRKEIDKNA